MRTHKGWSPLIDPATSVKPESASIFSAISTLERLVTVLGAASAARVLDIDRALVTRALKGKEQLSPEIARRIQDLAYVLARALMYFYPDEVGSWLMGPEPHLGGRVPMMVLALNGPREVVDAIDAIRAGSYA